jgi:hypothetical protein
MSGVPLFLAMPSVVVHQTIDRPPALVARVMFDPVNEPRWIDGAKKIGAFNGDATAIGTRVKRHGAFWGREFSWVTETSAHEPDAKLVLNYVEGPMTGSVTYEIAPDGKGSKVTLRSNTASAMELPGQSTFLKRTLQADLGRLKRLVEKQPR